MTNKLDQITKELEKTFEGTVFDRASINNNPHKTVAWYLLDEHVERIHKALALLKEVEEGKAIGKFKPIETVPKDGTRVIVSDGNKFYVSASWIEEYEGHGFFWATGTTVSDLAFNPTIWTEIPMPKGESDE